MNEKVFQNALFDDRVRRGVKLMCPNYTPKRWWECDLFTVTEAGYSTEYEIKLTKYDFMKDAAKSDNSYDARRARRSGREMPGKHELLAARSERCPNRFFYVVPDGMLTEAEVPEWAGLITIENYHGRWRPSTLKEAPRLHKTKISEEQLKHLHSVFYYRYWNLRQRVWPASNYHKPVTQEDIQESV